MILVQNAKAILKGVREIFRLSRKGLINGMYYCYINGLVTNLLCYFRNNFLHFFPFGFHVSGKRKLCSGTDQIVFRICGSEIQISVQVVFQKPDADFHRNGKGT